MVLGDARVPSFFFSLVLGSPDGKLREALDKLFVVEAKNGPFSGCFVLGGPPSREESDLSALFDFVKRDLQFKFPCYFVAGVSRDHMLEASLIEELALRNVHFCRPHGLLKTAEGLVVAFVSGVERRQQASEEELLLEEHDIDRVEEEYLKDQVATVDILLSWSWPERVVSPLPASVPPSRLLKRLAYNMKPRYMFAPSHDEATYLERQPYGNIDDARQEFMYATRFIALAPCLNAADKKWIYALSMVPARFMSASDLAKSPEPCTANPLQPKDEEDASEARDNFFYEPTTGIGHKRKAEQAPSPTMRKAPPSGYVCKRCHGTDHFFRDCRFAGSDTYVCHICHEPGHYIRNCPKKTDNEAPSLKQVVPEACWFCLANPTARKHLIIDVGEAVYLTLAKGPLSSQHLLLIPIDHVAGDVQLGKEIADEIASLKTRIARALEADGLFPVYFRLSQNCTHHWHEQMVAIPQSRAVEFREFLSTYAAPLGFDFKSESESESGEASSLECFFEFSLGSEGSLRHCFGRKAFFPAQFGRQVLAAFLDIKDGAHDWKQAQSEDTERQFVAAWKSRLQ